MKLENQIILVDRKIKVTKYQKSFNVGLDTPANLTEDVHHELKMIVSPSEHVGKFTHKLLILEGEFIAYAMKIECIDDKFMGHVNMSCILETYDATLEELKEKKEQAKNDLATLREMGALSKPSGEDLAAEVSDLFKQTFFKKQ